MVAAPANPVYIQHFYDAVLLTPLGFEAMKVTSESDIPGHGRILRNPDGSPTGWIEGDNPAITGLFDRLPLPGFSQSYAGTIAFFHELNRLGMTGVLDPGGFNLNAESYQPLFHVWHDGKLSLRVRFSMFAQRPGHELEDYQSVLSMMPMGFGDDMLRFNGVGENVTWGMYNNDHPSAAQQAQYLAVARWAASRGMTLTQHWLNSDSVPVLLDIFEQVNRETPIAPLRWSIAHLDNLSDANLARMKALGVGWTMQDALYFAGERFRKAYGDAVARMPPIVTAVKMGEHVGGGTDAHRVMSYNPFVSLRWMIDGLTVAGAATRTAPELTTRDQALRLYTLGSAWFTFEEGTRGSLEPGKMADLAVLSDDYFSVPVDRIDRIESVLTMVGGKVVYER
jgi:predicted amidohydrolase YtcJ